MSVTQFHRYRTYFDRVVTQAYFPHATGHPPVAIQAEEIGGVFTRISKGLPDQSVCNFSPSLLQNDKHKLILWRSQPESFVFRHDMKYFYYNNTPTDLYIGELLDDETIIGGRKLRNTKHRLSYEDGRLFINPTSKSLMCQFVTSSYASKWDSSSHVMVKSPKICVGEVNEFGNLTDCIFPQIGQNMVDGGSEKNWCFYADGEELRLLYSTIPLTIKTPGKPDRTIDSQCLKELTGEHPTFNSTAPVKIGDEWLVFYHFKFMAHEIDRRPYLLYGLSCYCLDEKQTKIVRMMKEPLFMGSTNDHLITWTDSCGNDISHQPACILPFGCTIENEKELVMPLGINDCFMGIFRAPLVHILGLMTKI